MFRNCRRLFSVALALFGAASAFATLPSAQAVQQTDAQVRLVNADLEPLPASYIAIRAMDGRVIVPSSASNGEFLFANEGTITRPSIARMAM